MRSESKTKFELDYVWGILRTHKFEMPSPKTIEDARLYLNKRREIEGKRPIAKGWTTFKIGILAYYGRPFSKKSGQALHINRYLQHLASMERDLYRTTK
jgi:hypothetical protein